MAAAAPARLDVAPGQLERLAGVLHRCAGLVFDSARHPVLAAALAERLPTSAVADVDAYLALVEDDRRGAEERARLLDLVTVPETFFFRTSPHIDALRDHVLPRLLDAAARERRGLTVWSAGCSSGEEAYTLALMLRDLAPAAGVPLADVHVVGTDVSSRAVAAARRGVYGPRSLQMVPAPVLRSRFRVQDGGMSPVDDVRALARFDVHNLVADPPPFPPGSVDLVLCRNVTIYFRRETTRQVVERIAEVLRPEGRLLLGPAETLWQLTDRLVPDAVDEVHLYGLPGDRSPGRRPAGGRSAAEAASGARPGREPSPAERPGGDRGRSDATPLRRLGQALLTRRRTATASVTPSPEPSTSPPAVPPAEVLGQPPAPAAPPSAQRAAEEQPPGLAAALEALRAGDWVSARERTVRLAEDLPLLPVAHFLHGLALVNAGEDDAALAALRRAAYLEPDDGLTHVLLAGVHARRGAEEAARRSYRRAAVALRRRPPEDLAGVLDGLDAPADVEGLVALCRRLGTEPGAQRQGTAPGAQRQGTARGAATPLPVTTRLEAP